MLVGARNTGCFKVSLCLRYRGSHRCVRLVIRWHLRVPRLLNLHRRYGFWGNVARLWGGSHRGEVEARDPGRGSCFRMNAHISELRYGHPAGDRTTSRA
jgi:hypothetical protein